MLRRARGFDVPDFLAAGPRDVLVPASGAPAARDVLLQSELLPDAQAACLGPTAWRVPAIAGRRVSRCYGEPCVLHP